MSEEKGSLRIEARGIRCLDCSGLDLQRQPEGATPGEGARLGFGWCSLATIPHYVSIQMSRNCSDFVEAVPEVVQVREKWAEKIVPFWKK